MNEGNMFQSPAEVARELAQEIREFKEVLREISKKLGQIETRAKRAFPSAFPATPGRNSNKEKSKEGEQPTLSPGEALQLYDQLVQSAKAGTRDQVQQRLESLRLADLGLLCRELGVSLGKKRSSRPALISGILGRVNESVMLSSSSLRERPKNQESRASEPSAGSKEKVAESPQESGPMQGDSG